MLTRWNDRGAWDWARTLSDFETLRREMNRVFSEDERPRRVQSPRGFPRIGLFDEKEQLTLRAEVPGMKDSDFDISVDEGTLTVRGTRSVAIPEGYDVHRQERAETTFARSFGLPCRVNAELATARLQSGVLTLTLPKAPEVKPKQITVKASA